MNSGFLLFLSSVVARGLWAPYSGSLLSYGRGKSDQSSVEVLAPVAEVCKGWITRMQEVTSGRR